jgi:hypothetical protein
MWSVFKKHLFFFLQLCVSIIMSGLLQLKIDHGQGHIECGYSLESEGIIGANRTPGIMQGWFQWHADDARLPCKGLEKRIKHLRFCEEIIGTELKTKLWVKGRETESWVTVEQCLRKRYHWSSWVRQREGRKKGPNDSGQHFISPSASMWRSEECRPQGQLKHWVNLVKHTAQKVLAFIVIGSAGSSCLLIHPYVKR